MRLATFTSRYRKDLKRCLSRGYDAEKLRVVFEAIMHDNDLPSSCRPHKLVGNYTGCWECHIAPDWLLIYELPDEETLVLRRTGTHSDLF